MYFTIMKLFHMLHRRIRTMRYIKKCIELHYPMQLNVDAIYWLLNVAT